MTDPRHLLEVHGSMPLLMFVADVKAGAEAVWGWREAGLTVRVVRGRKMRTVDGLFDEFAAALQFPSYFGENWAAFDECLADMDWLPVGAGVVIVIGEPGDVLTTEDEAQLAILVRSITRAAATYAQPIESGEWWDRPAVPFHVALHAAPNDAAVTRTRWHAAGADISELTI